jgi:hypothetical protein
MSDVENWETLWDKAWSEQPTEGGTITEEVINPYYLHRAPIIDASNESDESEDEDEELTEEEVERNCNILASVFSTKPKQYSHSEYDDEDREEDREEVETETVTEALFSSFMKDVQVLASKTIHAYFDDKQMYCGGPIPQSVLDSPEYITQLLNANMSCIDRIYECLGRANMFQPSGQTTATAEDIRFVVKLVHSIEKSRIPRCFVPGILLMHMEFIEGVSMD